MILSGPPGVGKTHSVEGYLSKHCQTRYKVIKGHMTVFSLYGQLFLMKDQGNVLVLDDVDSAFSKIEGLNILKAALDTTASRTISWQSASSLVGACGLPQQFTFSGSVILITNEGRGHFNKKLTNHYEALRDRTYHLKIASDSAESKLHQINFMILRRNLLADFRLTNELIIDILDYINENYQKFEDLSLRTAIKAADLAKIYGSEWKDMAKGGLQND
jgi:hypothetical protein